jgi:pimeloyl-ACP methyl ester carboxylesterase
MRSTSQNTHAATPLAHNITAVIAVATIAAAARASVGDAAPTSPPPAAEHRIAQGPWGGESAGSGHYADVNGIRLYYEVAGAGKPLVLLHGGLGAIEMFGPNLPALAKGRRVIAVDLQGHGRTADVDRPIAVEAMGEDIAALITHLDLERPDIMGYSLGGGVALQVAIHHPELVGKLVLVSTPIRRNAFFPEILAQQAFVNSSAVEMMKSTPMYKLYASVAPHVEDFPRLLDKMGEGMKRDFDFSSGVAKIEAPTLIVAGDADIFPVAHAIEIFELLGGGKRDGGWDGSGRSKSSLAILPGLTHYTIFSAPALAAAVIPFLDQATHDEQVRPGA